ncbi:hypothetical protein [Aeromicrobium sp. UC242_57]|uniref:hypothetical protein n=1 Tax=Aeromicrobium sp. UC242_57 TaxID=3374624 RepID=UPI0037B07992
MSATASGIVIILLGAWLRADVLAIVGFAVLGAGIGTGSRTALVALTKGSGPAQQGALASLYAAVCYAVAAVVVTTVGLVGMLTGLVPAVVGALATFGIMALTAATWAPRVRDAHGLLHTHNRPSPNYEEI